MPRSDADISSRSDLPNLVSDYLSRVSGRSTVSQIQLWGSDAVHELESKIAAYYGMKHALCVPNATTGLLVIALALDLSGSDFITGSYGYGASIASWLMLGCRPVFGDIDQLTLTLDSEEVRRIVTQKTRAILAADLFGNPSDIIELRKLADELGLWLVADCAQSFGASRHDQPAGTAADALVISFTAGKTLFAGEGGAIVTNSSEIYERLLFYSQHPYRQKCELGLAISNEFGFNGRIHPLAAIWANSMFAESLEILKYHQDRCFKLIDLLNKTDLFRPIDLEAKQIRPSFFHLTAELNETQIDLNGRLSEIHPGLASVPAPASLFYQNPAFRAQFSHRFHLPVPCLVAEQQVRSRVAIVLSDNEFHS